MLDELFWILLRPLIFFQTQWLSFFAGILWGYFLRKSGGTSRIQLLKDHRPSMPATSLQRNPYLALHCGQIFNAGLQATGESRFLPLAQ